MKILALISTTALLAVGLFISGWRVGSHQRQVGGLYAVPLVDKRINDAAMKATILHLMDLGQYSDARVIIQGQFNNEILQVALDSDDWGDSRNDWTRRACAAIVAFRSAYPSNYLCSPDGGDRWTVDQVNAYLKRMADPNR